MPAILIDLNADLGERPGDAGLAADAELLRYVSSANVACGYHAGDGATMQAVCALAVALHKRIGAHVSYLDPEGFGRRELEVPAARLQEHVVAQIGALRVAARVAGGEVRYVKPHGALYHRACGDASVARTIVEAVASVDRSLALLGMPDSELLRAADAAGLSGVAEGFADRAYLAGGALAPRTRAGALLSVEAALAQAREITFAQRAPALDGGEVPLRVRSLCVHSDTPGAAELARRLRDHLIGAGAEIRPFT